MKITVIIPVYNDPRIRRALDSVLLQRGVPELEIIVVDGDSSDETAEIVQEYTNDIDVLIREPDDGVYDAMNKGINQSTGDIVGILNSDDRYEDSDVIQSAIKAFETSNADLCYGDMVLVNDDDKVIRYWKGGPYHPSRFYFGWMPPHPTVFVKQEVYARYSRFDLEFPIAADYELLLRLLLRQKLNASYTNKVHVRMELGGKSNATLTNILKANWEAFQAWRKNGFRGGIQIPILKPLRKIPQHFHDYDHKCFIEAKDSKYSK